MLRLTCKRSAILGVNVKSQLGFFHSSTRNIETASPAEIQIKLSSFDHQNPFWGISLPPDAPKIGLPESRSLYTVLRSPHIDKKSREQFQVRINKKLVVIKTDKHELAKKLFWLKRSNCGLSPEVTISTSQRLTLETSNGSDKVLALLKDHGFTDAHISKIVSKRPALLRTTKPEKTLLPRLKFLSSIGASTDAIASNAELLCYSLEIFEFFNSMVLSEKQIAPVLSHLLLNSASFVPNVALLKETGVPQKYITELISTNHWVMKKGSNEFKECVEEVLRLQFEPSKVSFIRALDVIGGMSKSTWEYKKEIFKSWGWSDHDLVLAVKKHPKSMALSVKQIISVMDFLVNKMGFQSTAIARTPTVLSYSLEKRIGPRCKVIKFLQLKGLIKEDTSLISFLLPMEKDFLDNYLLQYKQEVPELLTVYQGNQN